MKQALLIGTSNPGKYREIVAVLCDLGVKLANLNDMQDVPVPLEDGETFMANAEHKARHFARLTGLAALADDSGLEVDCLGGRPGVHSARFAGAAADAQANNRKLLQLLRSVPLEQRTARFRCAVAVADHSGVFARAEGRVEGLIIDTPRGHNGFGYDPYFLVPELGRTVAELDTDHKNRISHRGQALARIRAPLAAYLQV